MARMLKNFCLSLFVSILPVLTSTSFLLSASNTLPNVSPGSLPPDNVIKTEIGLSPEELVRNVFAGGTCDNITQIVGLGHSDALGYFENGEASIGLDRGIILSTGPISYAAHANSTGDKSGDFGNADPDPDLSKLATGSIRDRVGLEFDFVPLDSFVTFRYVFASEEYCEFVGSKYNDVFGFFVSGPGIQGGFTGDAKNVALIPGSEDFVSINNVNHKKNSQHYINNTRKRDAERCGMVFTPTEHLNYIEYDGFTVVLTAILKLNPCETYHIRLVVADVADNFYDSAVFLEAGSFDLGGQVSLRAFSKGDEPVSEGCSDAYFEFSRDENQSTIFPLHVQFRLRESSTAIPGLDFAAIPASVTIPAGQKSFKLPIQVLTDDLNEGEEKLEIELDIPCACYTDAAELLITEPPELHVDLKDQAICPDQSVILIPEVSGGNPDYLFQWSDGSVEERLEVSQVQDIPFTLTVTDACGQEAIAQANVRPSIPPSANISGMEEICLGDTAWLKVDFTGIAPWNITYSLDGEPMPAIKGVKTNPFYLGTTSDGDYELIHFSDAGCQGEVEGLASVNVMEIRLDQQTFPVTCAGGTDGKILLELPEDFPPYTHYWENRQDTTASLHNLEAGEYTFHLEDGRGCSQSISVRVNEPEPLLMSDIDCDQILFGDWQPVPRGGIPPYQYFLEGIPYNISGLMQKMEAGNLYPLLIKDANGCTLQDTILMPLLGSQVVDLPPKISLILGNPYQFNPKLYIPNSLLAGIRWLPGENLSCDDCLKPELLEIVEGVYSLHLIDRFGCTYIAETQIVLNSDYPIYIPNVFSPNGDEKNDRFGLMTHSAIVGKVINFCIYNRWGNQLYQVANISPDALNAQWDGTANGREMPTGVYVYHFEIELTNGETKKISGDVLLVR